MFGFDLRQAQAVREYAMGSIGENGSRPSLIEQAYVVRERYWQEFASQWTAMTPLQRAVLRRIVVAPDTPIVNFVDGAKSELKAGAKIIAFVAKQSDGTLASKRVLVGRDGITPPM
jgi:hypothetical protein